MENKVVIPQNIISLFKVFNNNDILYCHWKSNEHLNKGLVGKTDLDVLVSDEQQETVEEILKNNNFIKMKSHSWNTYSGVEDWIGMDTRTTIQTHLHLHYSLITGKQNVKELHLPWEKLVLNESVIDDNTGILICNPNVEIVIFISRILLKRFDFKYIPNNNKEFLLSKPDQQELDYLRLRVEEEKVREVVQNFYSASVSEEIVYLLNTNVWKNKDCLKLKRKISSELKQHLVIGRLKTFMISLVRYATQTIARCVKHPINKKKKCFNRGKLISFLGVDGSGKTTIAKDTQKWLSWKIDCRYVYLGSGQGKGSILNRLLRSYSNKKALSGVYNKTDVQTTDENTAMTIKKALRQSVLNVISYSNTKYKYRTLKKINILCERGVYVLTDRFPQKKFIGINDGPAIRTTGRTAFDLLNNFLCKRELILIDKMLRLHPDAIIKLVIPYEISRMRKQDSSEESIRKKIQIVDALHYDGTLEYNVSSERLIEETQNKVRNIIWSLL